MVKTGKVHLRSVVAISIALAAMLFYKMGDANLSHLTGASGILTMRECLACHSGSSAKPVSICIDDHCLYKKNHSLMRRYPPPGKEREYASEFEITEAGCVLEDGKLTCLSCHDLTKPPPHLIRTGDNLCYICHRYFRQ